MVTKIGIKLLVAFILAIIVLFGTALFRGTDWCIKPGVCFTTSP